MIFKFQHSNFVKPNYATLRKIDAFSTYFHTFETVLSFWTDMSASNVQYFSEMTKFFIDKNISEYRAFYYV